MSSLVFRITGDPSAFKAAMGEVSGSLDSTGRKADELSNRLGSLGSKLSIGITAPVIALGVSVVKTATDMDSLKRGLAAVAGSSEEAERQLKRLQEVAKLPGLGFKDAVEGSIRLQAAGFNAQLAERSLKAFGNALATVGKGKAELDGVTLALSQIASKGKISAEEINQLAERVPQIRQAMVGAFGTADTEVLQKAGIKAEEFVTRVVAQLEKLKQVTGGPQNAFENLSDAVQRTATRIGNQMLPAVESVIPKIESAVVMVGDLADGFSSLSQQTQVTALSIGGLAVAAGPIAVTVSQVMKLSTEMSALGITASSVAGVAGGLVLAYRSLGDALEIKEKLKETTYQFQQFTGVAEDARKDIEYFKDQVSLLSTQFPVLGKAISMANGELASLVRTATSPGWEFLKRGLDALNGAMRLVTGRSQEMDDAIRSSIQRNIDLGAQTIKLSADSKNFGGAAGDLIPKLNSVASSTRDVTKELAALSQATNKITVDSVAAADATGALSKHSLLYVEIQERTKAAIGKVKDVMYEYITAGSIYGKQIEMQRAPLTELAIAADDYRLALAKTRFELEAMGKMPPLQMATPTQPARQGTVFETDDILRRAGGTSARESRARVDQLEADLQRVKQLNQEGKATGNDVIAVQKALDEEYRKLGQTATVSGKAQKEAIRQVSLVLTDLSRGITDVIFKGGKFGDVMKNVALEAAKSITRILIEGALMKLGKTLLGIGSTSASVFGGISSAIGGLFGGGAKSGGMIFSAAGSGAQAAGGISGMLGGAGSAAGSVGSAAGSIVGAGVSGVAGIVTGAVSAVSGIIGNFQMMGMNKTLDLIEKSTRYAEAYQLSILEKTNEFLPKLADIHQRLIEFRTLGVKLEAGGSLAMAGGGEVFYFDFSGANLNGQSQQNIEKMLESAITRLKQKGLSK